jgi:hypothetical protein
MSLVMKVALRIHISGMEDPLQWDEIIGKLQFELSNTKSETIQITSNEFLCGFTPNNLNRLVTGANGTKELNRPTLRIYTYDAVALAFIRAKLYYNNQHQPRFFTVGDRALLRPHRGYEVR